MIRTGNSICKTCGHRYWKHQTMRAPGSGEYCLAARNPDKPVEGPMLLVCNCMNFEDQDA